MIHDTDKIRKAAKQALRCEQELNEAPISEINKLCRTVSDTSKFSGKTAAALRREADSLSDDLYRVKRQMSELYSVLMNYAAELDAADAEASRIIVKK